MLKLTNITKTFNPGTITEKKVLRGIDLELDDGDFVTVIGGNGAGKSTLLNIIAGVHYPDTGFVSLNDKDMTIVPEHIRAKYLGRVFQDPMMGTAANMSIEENLAMAMRRGKKRGLCWHIKDNEREFYKERLSLLELGLENRLSAKIGLLSGGQRQAITLLMATLQKPELLLLDEHTAALDPKTAKKVLEITDALVKKDNLTTFMVTHNMKDALLYGNRLIMMMEGKIIFDVKGEEKKKLTVEDLLEKFSVNGEMSDKIVLS
ncbi:MAG: ABC transporter ATP-binding protein [Treponema sp.]|nr:ABC transporter ATP-binding protein [Treponema sp.]MCI6545445.1 ABC transporter ATP-binding protein [Spirochaetia bacterium]MCI7435174.1 ABC transporter ATP-binding protein [Spirochaetia bacterium]MDY2824411.1 ABC transporter ATP-binding protein [Treponema sp.]MEE1268736.1 ABC transporter ATP-binding protein [Treponema sp.]